MAKVVTKTKIANVVLPPDIEQALSCDFACALNKKIAFEFGFNAGQLVALALLIRDFYVKVVSVASLEELIAKRLNVPKETIQKLAYEICTKRLLIVNKWLGGEPAKKLKQLGGSPDDFASFVDQYIEELTLEEINEAEALAAQQALENSEPVRDLAEGKMQTMAEVMKDPEAEKKASLEVFASNVKDVLESADLPLRVEVNARLIALLVDDEETKMFQKEILEELYNNAEPITGQKILLKNEKVEPTIGHWLQDYVMFVGVEGAVNSLKKAQYLADSQNIESLTPAGRPLVDKLLNLYGAIKNFYVNVEKMELADMEIFPFTDEERQQFIKSAIKTRVDVEPMEAGEEEPEADIAALYAGKPGDRALIDKEKAKLLTQTRGEIDKVGDELERQLMARQKFPIVACLELLAENGALDDLLARDKRYQTFLNVYFKRNGLVAEAADFAQNPRAVKHLRHFLRFIFLERLGIPENEGARLVANLANTFMANGLMEYGDLAYLDLSDKKFKWS